MGGWTVKKLNDDRQRRMDRQRDERLAAEEAKRAEVTERLREEAAAPAFEREIEDCRTLIDQFSRSSGSRDSAPSPAATNGHASNLPKLELRKVDNAAPEGAVALKKKGKDEEEYFVGKKGKKRGGDKKDKANGGSPSSASSQALQLPMPTLSALIHLGITVPLAQSDLSKTTEELKQKKAWFEENQVRYGSELVCRGSRLT
jgi:hypothetical protein